MKIKTILFGILLTIALLMPGHAASQGLPVYDNTNFISFAKSLLESAKQTSELLKTVQFLKQQKENIENVAGAIKQLKAVQRIVANNEKLYGVIQNDLRDILNSPYIKPEEINRVSDSFNTILENSLDNLDFIDQILSSSFLKMNDAERTKILKQKELESKEMVSNISVKTKRYREIISFRKMQDMVNNRETNY